MKTALQNNYWVAYLIWRARRSAALLGYKGLIGILCCLVAVILGVQSHLLSTRLNHTEQQVVQQQHKAMLATISKTEPVSNQLNDFYRFFAREETLEDWLATVDGISKKSHIASIKTSYTLIDTGSLKLLRYQLTMPVTGNYLEVRGFIAELLEKIPVASLDELNLTRDKIGDAQLNAVVKLSLYLPPDAI